MLPEKWSTRRLVLRPPERGDAEAMFQGWATDSEVTRYLTWRPNEGIHETREFLNGCIDAWRGLTRRPWLITRVGGGEPIGMVELRLDGHRADLGYVLARSAWGKGYMTEVAQTLVQMALHDVPVARVSAVCDVENGASARVLEKSGMVREGRLRRYIVHPNVSDEPRDVYLYARTRPLHASMQSQHVLRVLEALAVHNVAVWIAGGWGIDALLERQTREHTDLDLAFRAEDLARLQTILAQLGYRVVLDELPGRVVVADDDGHEVDLHRVHFDSQGRGVQSDLRGGTYEYPADAFTHGSIAGRRVPCLSAEQQVRFHTGYTLREHERQDLARLQAAFGDATPLH
jgi:[ribosomal protein S5]-alanine N-acetyltransferase